MKANLFKGYSGDQKEELERDFKSSTLLRKAIINHLEDLILFEREQIEKKSTFFDDGWKDKHINSLAYIRAMKDLKALLS